MGRNHEIWGLRPGTSNPDDFSIRVVLSCGDDSFPHYDMLISLHDECMPFFSRFERVAEIVGTDEKDSRLGRERFKFYRDRGYELRHFDLNRTQP